MLLTVRKIKSDCIFKRLNEVIHLFFSVVEAKAYSAASFYTQVMVKGLNTMVAWANSHMKLKKDQPNNEQTIRCIA